MKCPVCGSENPNGAKTCVVCGASLVPPVNRGNAGQAMPQPKPPKKKRSKKPLVISLVVGAAIVFLGLGCFLIFSNQNRDVMLQDNVVIYNPHKPTFEIENYTDYKLTVSTLGNIKEGSVVACPVTDKTPNGLLVKVDSISQVSNGYELQTEQAALTDAILKCDINKETAFLEDEVTQDIEEADNITLGFTKAEAEEEGVRAFSYDDGVLKDEAWLSLVTGLKVESGDVDMKLGIKVHEITSLSLEKRQDLIDKTNNLFEFKKPLTVWVGPLPVVLSNKLEVSMPTKVQASASLTQSAETDKVYGFHYTTQDGMKPLESGESESRGPTFTNPEGTITATLTFGPKLSFSSELYGVAGPEIEAALENKLEANMTVTTGSIQVENPIMIPGTSVQAYGSIDGSITVPISGKFVLEIPSFNIFDGGSNKTEADLFNTGDAITLWSYSLKTEGPVLFGNLTSDVGANLSQPITGTLKIMTRAEANRKYYPVHEYNQAPEPIPFDDGGEEANAKIAILEVDEDVTVSSTYLWDLQNQGKVAWTAPEQLTIQKGKRILLGSEFSGDEKSYTGKYSLDFLSTSMKDIVNNLTPYDGQKVSIELQKMPTLKGSYEIIKTNRATDAYITLLGCIGYSQHFKVIAD